MFKILKISVGDLYFILVRLTLSLDFRAKALLGNCYKLEKDARAVFMRCMTLFSLHQTRGDEDEQAGGNQQMYS